MKKSKLLIGTLSIISSTCVFAHGYKGEMYKGEAFPAQTPVTIPNLNGGFEFTIGALYLRPTTANNRYLTSFSSFSAGSTSADEYTVYDVDQEYDWGYQIGVGYVIPNSSNDVRVDWQHLDANSDENRVVNAEDLTNVFLSIPLIVDSGVGSDGAQINTSAQMENHFDVIDLTFGQFINVGPRLHTRLFTGLRYMRLQNELEASYEFENNSSFSTQASLVGIYNTETTSTFNGLGPVFGITADYNAGWGLGVTATVDAALLVGNIDFEPSYVRLNSSLNPVVDAEFDYDDQGVVSPAFDAKLGVNYGYHWNNGMMFTLELGYQVTKYFDVIESFDDSITRPLETAANTDLTNFGLNGPYLTLNVKV